MGAPFAMPVDPPHEFCDVQLQLASTAILGDPGDDQCDYSGQYPPLTLAGYVDNYANQATYDNNTDALADLGAVMSCLTAEQIPVLSTLAREFAVCDRWFSSMPGPTWPNRFFMHAATSGGLDRSPNARETARSQFGGYRFENGSIFEALDRGGLAWRVYHDDPLPQVSALSVMDLDTMRSHYRRVDDLRSDLQDEDFAPAYVFIEPNYGLLEPPLGDFMCGNSQHPCDDVTRGDALIKLVYEAVRNSPHWESSLLVITYDEHGGFYDHVPPPPGVPPGDVTEPATTATASGSICSAYGYPRSSSRRGFASALADGSDGQSGRQYAVRPHFPTGHRGTSVRAAVADRAGRRGQRLSPSAGGGYPAGGAAHPAGSRAIGAGLRGRAT